MGIASRYAELVADVGSTGGNLRAHSGRMGPQRKMAIRDHGRVEFLQDNPTLAAEYSHRMPNIHPSSLQVELLRRYRSGDATDAVKRAIEVDDKWRGSRTEKQRIRDVRYF